MGSVIAWLYANLSSLPTVEAQYEFWEKEYILLSLHSISSNSHELLSNRASRLSHMRLAFRIHVHVYIYCIRGALYIDNR